MDRDYHPLPIRELGAEASFRRPTQPPPAARVTPESAALQVMTDLTRVSPATIRPPAQRTMVRGIFSISQIARQLGVSLPAGGEVARTFSEIEAAIR
jgi:hypothetical protein